MSIDLEDYHARLAKERNFFQGCENVHNLPDIFHYWSDKYVRPKLAAVGFRGAQELFGDCLAEQCARNPERESRFLSIGSGNCDLEIELAETLTGAGHSRFVIDCLELNETMLERGRAAALEHAVARHVNPIAGDFNHWTPTAEYDGVIAIQALHHVVNLEGLFAAIRASLRPGGVFVVSDMIGRNGHMRWPEALAILDEYWRRLPPSYRYNHQLQRYEERFDDWDCSKEGFEGVRAQDILPLLLEHFHFQRFVAFGNLIDPFVERSFGHNFHASNEWDRAFIDEVHHRDEQEMTEGRLKPTHMFAVMTKADLQSPTLCIEPFRPEFCVRRANPLEPAAPRPQDPYAWASWPHPVDRELEIACRRLSETQGRAGNLLDENLKLKLALTKLNQEFLERTHWALDLDKEVALLRSELQAERDRKHRLLPRLWF